MGPISWVSTLPGAKRSGVGDEGPHRALVSVYTSAGGAGAGR
jgi:hypothetical protein